MNIINFLLKIERKEFSITNVINYLEKENKKISTETLYNYLEALCSTFII